MIALHLITFPGLIFLGGLLAQNPPSPDHRAWAKTPPMGWNSRDCFGTTITEVQAKMQADVMAHPQSMCAWNPDMFGVDMRKPGADFYRISSF